MRKPIPRLIMTQIKKQRLEPKSGVYETIYGNAVRYRKGSKTGYDLDMRERVPIDMIDFSKRVR